MKTLKARSGPFSERPFFTVEEIDQIAIDELQKFGLYPSSPSPIRIERFINQRFKVSPTYEDLPDDVLGYTRFGKKGVQDIIVSRSLSDEGTTVSENRVSSTLAHEAGHGLLHTHLFVLGAENQSLFNHSDVSQTKVLCRQPGVLNAGTESHYHGQWWEYQANLCMGALLLPKPLVLESMKSFVSAEGIMGITTLPNGRREQAVRHVADVFEVNPIVARIRIAQLYPQGSEQQMAF